MNTTDDITDEEFNDRIKKYLKDAKEKFEKAASEENPDPTAPNPYQMGTKEYERHQMECFESLQNMGEKDDKRWKEKIEKMKQSGKASRLLNDKEIENAKKLFESPGYYTEYLKRLDAQRAAQNAALADDDT